MAIYEQCGGREGAGAAIGERHMDVKNSTSNPIIAIVCVVAGIAAAVLYANGQHEIAAGLGAVALVAVVVGNIFGRRKQD
jgi:uncharacterized membrane protein